MNGQPRVTIAIPTRNRAGWLREAVVSVLSQSYRDFELLISDNCSDDCTTEVVAEFADPRIRFFRQAVNLGMVGNWNFCLEHSRGELFLLLSDDDLLEPGAIEWLQSQLQDQSVTLAYGRVRYIDERGSDSGCSRLAPAVESGDRFVRASLRGQRGVLPCATMHRTATARELGGYPDIGTASDAALRLAVALKGTVKFSPVPLARYRLHEEALSEQRGQVLDSHRAFVVWTGGSGSPLSCYLAEVRGYSARVAFATALSQAVRGNTVLAEQAMGAAREARPSVAREMLFWTVTRLPIRAVTELRRRIRRGLMGQRRLFRG